MSNFRYIIVLAFSLFSISSNAELITEPEADKTTLDEQETVTVVVSFNQAIEGDLYIATVINGVFWFLDNDGTGLFLKEQVVPFVTDGEFSEQENLELLTLNAQDIAPGTYTLFQVVTKSGGDPFESNDWLPTPTPDSLDTMVLNINLTDNEPEPEPEIPDLPVPGGSRFGLDFNTSFADGYFTPKLKQRVLNYDDAKNTFEEWDVLSPEVKKKTLYWKDDQLLADDGEGGTPIPVDILGKPFIKTYSNISLTISDPLTSSFVTAYPGCADVPNLAVHHRVCGEFNNDVILGSEVFSQRWTRPNNLDVENDPLYADIEDKANILYDLTASVGAVNIMSPEELTSFPLAFEISVSKVPGDFSENACKPNKAVQYSGALAISLTQVGLKTFDPLLPERCKVDTKDSKHYYFNVRAVNIDVEKKEINESLCRPGLVQGGIPINCKFEVLNFLD